MSRKKFKNNLVQLWESMGTRIRKVIASVALTYWELPKKKLEFFSKCWIETLWSEQKSQHTRKVQKLSVWEIFTDKTLSYRSSTKISHWKISPQLWTISYMRVSFFVHQFTISLRTGFSFQVKNLFCSWIVEDFLLERLTWKLKRVLNDNFI